MPVGPIELLDDVGIDVATKAGETLAAAWPERMPTDPAFGKLVGNGRLGRKTKKGFYLYEGDKRIGPDPSAYADLGSASPGRRPSAEELEAATDPADDQRGGVLSAERTSSPRPSTSSTSR